MTREETAMVINQFKREIADIRKKNREEFRAKYMRENFGPNGFYSKLTTLGGVRNDECIR